MSLRKGAELLSRGGDRSLSGPFSRIIVAGLALESLVKGEGQETV